MLLEMPEVSELHPVPEAYVPVMRFKLKGVSIDLLYAKLALWVIPELSNDISLVYVINYHLLDFIIFYGKNCPSS